MSRKKQKQKLLTQARHLITQLNPRSPISEQYRTLRTNLQFASVDEKLQTVLVTSSGPGEGKSMTTANLAAVYAQTGQKVLLVDADLRKPTVHYTFRIDNLKGLSNLLVGESTLNEVIHTSAIENLDIISSGPIPPNPSELLGSKMMQSFIKAAKEHYDLVLFDTPPILAVADAQVLSHYVDGTILVVRSKQTEQEHVMTAKEALENTAAKLLGVVLNDREKKAASGYYYYGAD